MLTRVIDFFNNNISTGAGSGKPDKEPGIEVAACALLVEMAGIDSEFSETERKGIISILEDEFGLTDEKAREVMEIAAEGLKDNVDIWPFTSLINEQYSPDEKIRLMELVWKVVYADGHLDKHEDYLIKKLSRMLNLRHREVIDAKLKIMGRER